MNSGYLLKYKLLFQLALLPLTIGCAGRTAPQRPEATAGMAPYCADCNVILISLDALRADSLGAYGYNKKTSPNIDRLAAKGALFLNTYSQAPITFPSHMSIFTAQYPWTHQTVTITKDKLAPTTETLPLMLQKLGYHTVWVAPLNHPHLSLNAGFKKGFEEFISPKWLTDTSANTVFNWLNHNSKRKFFMFLHTYALHDPYVPQKSSLRTITGGVPSRYRDSVYLKAKADEISGHEQSCIGLPPEISRTNPANGACVELDRYYVLRRVFWQDIDLNLPEDIRYAKSLYDALIYEADTAVGKLYEKLKTLGLADKTILVLTSDHGEEFMEHGGLAHTQLYHETLHVPLIFIFPGNKPGTRIPRLTQSIDIAPTILEAVGAPALPQAEGHSLMPFIVGSDSKDSDAIAFSGGWNWMYAVRNKRYTYLVTDKCHDGFSSQNPDCVREEFYDRATDPGELNNIFSVSTRTAAELAAPLREKLKAAVKLKDYSWPAEISEKAREKILKTGYWQ